MPTASRAELPGPTHERPRTHRNRRLWSRVAFIVGTLAMVGLVNLKVTTKRGLNYEVSDHRLPLYVKALEFITRSAQYRQIADEITQGATSDSERVLKVFDWTCRQIKPTPAGWPIVDDHLLNIIIRGHGVTDQQADVFAALATYSGVPSFWRKVRIVKKGPGVILSFAHVDSRWRVFDVANGIAFRTGTGELATLDELDGHPELIPASVRLIDVGGVLYGDILTRASMPPVPHPLRAELQMPFARLWHELKVAVRLASEPDDVFE